MLQPKSYKYRKQHRGRLKGIASKGTKISFGEYGLKAQESSWISARQIEAARRVMTRYTRKGGKIWIRILPAKPVTARAAETAIAGLLSELKIINNEKVKKIKKKPIENSAGKIIGFMKWIC